jgi:rhomboid protease GluP
MRELESIPSEPARISAGSRHQAMDWSLVLASQGIETVIDYAEDGERWGLLIAPGDQERAQEAIRLYRLENRRWPWRQEVLQPGLLFDWSSVAWAGLMIVFFWLSTRVDLRLAGRMDNSAVGAGEWWRLFTAIWLHADLGHLAANLAIGSVLLGLAMGLYGTGPGLLAAYLAGAVGNVAGWILWPNSHYGLGASGMVMGALGLLAAHSLSLWRNTPHAGKLIVSGLCGGTLIFLLLGLAPGTDVVAHAGGFIGGVVFGGLLSLVSSASKKPVANLAAGFLFAFLVIWPWWRALSFSRS